MTDSADLAQINTAIHDGWFDLDCVVHDIERSELRLRVYPGRPTGRILKVERAPDEHALPPSTGELIVRNVVKLTIRDEAGIGWFTVAKLEFDAATSQVRLRSDVPLEISIDVRTLDVDLVSDGAVPTAPG